MKKITVMLSFIIISVNAFSQIITENVNFDNYVSSTDNDLSNNFINNFPDNSITQINTNGITGGALVPPNNVSWGNDVIKYCSIYKNLLNSDIITSMSFKFNSTLINPNSYQRALAFFMEGNSNGHNIRFYLNRDMSLSITSYNYAQSTNLSLTDNHWYKMTATYKSIGGSFNDEVFAKVEIFDLGISGTETPTSIGNHTATIYDTDLVNSTEYTLEISGTKWGGSEYLDNLIFNGEKNRSICSTLGVADNKITSNIELYPNPVSDILIINIPEFSVNNSLKLEIFNTIGKVVNSKTIKKITSEINLTSFSNGIYFVKITDNKGTVISTKKIIKK